MTANSDNGAIGINGDDAEAIVVIFVATEGSFVIVTIATIGANNDRNYQPFIFNLLSRHLSTRLSYNSTY